MNKRVIFLSVLLCLPFVVHAQGTYTGFINCAATDPATGSANPDECTYEKFMDMLFKVLNYAVYTIATPIATILMAYAGFNMITSGGDEGEYKKARKMLNNILIAYIIMLSAHLVIKLVFSFFFPADYSLLG